METEMYDSVVDEESSSPEFMLTTVDNPYDPFTDYESWLAYDEQNNYNTNSLLARMTADSKELSDLENEMILNHAVDDILDLFPGLYKVVFRSK